VNDFYLKYFRPNADESTLMRVSRQATIFWGVAQIAVAIAAQWLQQSVIDSGLGVLSLAAGPVLGAFLIGVVTTRIGAKAMLTGMLTGVAVLAWVWYTGATAWSWFALIGASVTMLVAAIASLVVSESTKPEAR
jgi:Na+/proline symporter